MGQLQCEQAGAGWDVGGGSREPYMIASASSPARGGGGGGTFPEREPGAQLIA